LKPARAKSSWDPISKKPIIKKAGGVAQGIGPEFKPHKRDVNYFGESGYGLLRICIIHCCKIGCFMDVC
jgi:hypothetical protein